MNDTKPFLNENGSFKKVTQEEMDIFVSLAQDIALDIGDQLLMSDLDDNKEVVRAGFTPSELLKSSSEWSITLKYSAPLTKYLQKWLNAWNHYDLS